MNNIIIVSTNIQPDDLYKVSFKVTYDDSTHITGHVFISTQQYESSTNVDLKAIIKQKVITNLGGETIE